MLGMDGGERKARGAVPVTVVGGYLGAGKTTLLNHLLRHADGRRLGVVVNDFGSINVDAALVVGVQGDMVQLGNGCICCTSQGDLVEALGRVLDVPEPPDHVIIETSGVSDPRRVAATLEQRAPRELAFVDAVVVVIDVDRHGQLGRRERIVAAGQLAAADIVVLNKIDLVDEPRLAALEAKVRRRSRGVRIVRVDHGRVAPALVLGVDAHGPERSPTLAPLATHVHEAGETHEHDHPHDHGVEFWTWSYQTKRPISARRLRRAIDALPSTVVRAKGIVHLASHPERRAVMHVVGRRAELCLDAPWGPEPPTTGLVVIGTGEPMPPHDLEQSFRACEVEPRSTGTGRAGPEWVRWVRRMLPARRTG
jgi:G3E family GTPase